MPIKKYLNCNERIRPIQRPEECWDDVNGQKRSGYYHYQCEECNASWLFNAYQNVWS